MSKFQTELEKKMKNDPHIRTVSKVILDKAKITKYDD